MNKTQYPNKRNEKRVRNTAGIVFAFLMFAGYMHPVSATGQTSNKQKSSLIIVPASVAIHHWDSYDFNDTTLIHRPEVSGQRFVDFIFRLQPLSEDKVTEAVNIMLARAEKEPTGRVYEYFLELAEKYLYNPDSPIRNDELYIPFVEYVLKDSRTDSLHRIRPRHLLGLLKKNRIGAPAEDFEYTLANGNQSRLYALESRYTLLFFNNPGCNACREIKTFLASSPVITRLTKNGTLIILAVYPDKDLTEWKKYAGEMPAQWINSYDHKSVIKDEDLYDLKAIPSLYLLDRTKRVLLKDADVRDVEKALAAN
ncbi:MAG: DUF5106 domain-containing protein [Dysgonamonadaceae bacterium]|jgi:hypothetical protein|nr:DUF5106 domain-containing protein [Dysgonamonadaceae bacterium]